MDRGKIIFLHGVSSSGKTRLAKALQEKFQEPYACDELRCNTHLPVGNGAIDFTKNEGIVQSLINLNKMIN